MIDVPWVWGWKFETDIRVSASPVRSPDFIRKVPAPNPGLTWILSSNQRPITLWRHSKCISTHR